MYPLATVGDAIKAHLPEILADLRASCASRPPWCDVPPDDQLNNLGGVICGLVDVALGDSDDPEIRMGEARAAAEHGEHRLRIGFAEDLLFTEYKLIRHVLWRFLHSNVPSTVAHHAAVRLDAAASVATLASLRGFHRPEFEARGEWPRVIEQLADRWPADTPRKRGPPRDGKRRQPPRSPTP